MRKIGDAAWRTCAVAAAIANRLWTAWLPFAGAAGYCVWLALKEGADLNDGSGDTTWAMAITMIAMCAFIASTGLLLGVVLRLRVDAFRRARREPTRAVTA